MNTVVYSREELYKEVWDEPVSVVAKRYGITDVALRKHLRKLNIPLPPRGYWSKIKAGSRRKPTPLPKKGKERLVVRKHGIGSPRNLPPKSESLSFLPDEVKRQTEEYLNRLTVPELLLRPHPLVRDTI